MYLEISPIPTAKYMAQNTAQDGENTWMNENTNWIPVVANNTTFLPYLKRT